LLKWINEISKRFSVWLSVLMLLGILYFGLNPRGFHAENNVTWIKDQNGIRLGRYGIAYTNSPFNSPASHSHKPNSLSVEIALKPDLSRHHGFEFLLVMHNGEDSKQLLFGKWRSWIIVMNGDDYGNKKKTKRIAVRGALLPQKIRFITITSGQEGTKVYLDGRLAKVRKDLVLEVPDGKTETRLVVGNSVYGRNSWTGDIYGLALYGYALTTKDVELHFERWSREHNFAFAKDDAPQVLYMFNEKAGEKALDRSGGNHHLEIPWRMKILKRELLLAPWYGFKLNRSFVVDIAINILGFIPFGFFLSATLLSRGGFVEKHSCLITVLTCLVISLFIEIVQAWMPSRSSQMLDVILNTLGAWLGAMFYRFSLRFSPKGTVT
jgi:hypothetical protein